MKRCPECRSRAVDVDGFRRVYHTAACKDNPVNNRPPRVGEYIVLMWTDSGEKQSFELDPVADHNDLMTEQQLHTLRSTVARMNRTTGNIGHYRIAYQKDANGQSKKA